jgi:uncharacterized membrane protein
MAVLVFLFLLLIGVCVALAIRIMQLRKQRLSIPELETLLSPLSKNTTNSVISTIAVLGSGTSDSFSIRAYTANHHPLL